MKNAAHIYGTDYLPHQHFQIYSKKLLKLAVGQNPATPLLPPRFLFNIAKGYLSHNQNLVTKW